MVMFTLAGAPSWGTTTGVTPRAAVIGIPWFEELPPPPPQPAAGQKKGRTARASAKPGDRRMKRINKTPPNLERLEHRVKSVVHAKEVVARCVRWVEDRNYAERQ